MLMQMIVYFMYFNFNNSNNKKAEIISKEKGENQNLASRIH